MPGNIILTSTPEAAANFKLSEILLNEYDILIKDLSSKIGCDGKSYIRLAVHDEKDNSVLINALKEILG